jgi:hypothetical protein
MSGYADVVQSRVMCEGDRNSFDQIQMVPVP